MNYQALFVAAFMSIVVVRMLIDGSDSADGQNFLRQDEPAIYWTIVAVGCAMVGFLIYTGVTDWPSR